MATKRKNKPAAKQPVKTRRLKQSRYKTFYPSKRIKPLQPKLPSALRLLGRSLLTLKNNWKLFVGISVIYGILSLVLVRGFSSGTNISDLKMSLKGASSGSFSTVSTAALLFSYLIGSGNGATTDVGGLYQTVLIVVASLASIWALRQVLAGNSIKIRDSFYKGLYPLVPFILVLLVIGLQLVPLLIGNWLFATVTGNGIAVTMLEKLLWGLLFLVLAVLSLYMICSSLFALYIVTLPDMTPMKALRSARQLVLYRRWLVLRKILFLPLALIVIGAVIFMPLVIVIASAVQWVFFGLSIFILVVVHGYMYTLYRELL